VFTVELWARVGGTNATQTDEGLTFSYAQIGSTQTAGGGIVSGGLVGGTLAPGFNEAGSRDGGPNDWNSDGVTDWGTTATAAANTNYMLARNATVGGVFGGGTLGQAADAQTWEFKLATFTLNASAVGPYGGSTTFKVVQPNAKNVVGAITYANGRVDSLAFSITSSNVGTAYSGSPGLTLEAIPEPSALGLMGAAAIGLIGRRRMTSCHSQKHRAST
jgi:hypothetical protein